MKLKVIGKSSELYRNDGPKDAEHVVASALFDPERNVVYLGCCHDEANDVAFDSAKTKEDTKHVIYMHDNRLFVKGFFTNTSRFLTRQETIELVKTNKQLQSLPQQRGGWEIWLRTMIFNS
jgi:hypothetical protein